MKLIKINTKYMGIDAPLSDEQIRQGKIQRLREFIDLRKRTLETHEKYLESVDNDEGRLEARMHKEKGDKLRMSQEAVVTCKNDIENSEKQLAELGDE